MNWKSLLLILAAVPVTANWVVAEDNPVVLGHGVGLFKVGSLLAQDDFENLNNWEVQIQQRSGSYGTRYWKVNAQESEHLAFTAKGKTLHAIKLAKPSAPFTIEATAGWNAADVKSVRLLGSEAAVDWTMTAEGLRITPPSDLGKSQFAWSFEIVTTSEQHHPNAIVSNPDQALKRTGKVDLDGNAK